MSVKLQRHKNQFYILTAVLLAIQWLLYFKYGAEKKKDNEGVQWGCLTVYLFAAVLIHPRNDIFAK